MFFQKLALVQDAMQHVVKNGDNYKKFSMKQGDAANREAAKA